VEVRLVELKRLPARVQDKSPAVEADEPEHGHVFYV